MRAVRLFLLMTGCAALLCGPGAAARAGRAPQQRSSAEHSGTTGQDLIPHRRLLTPRSSLETNNRIPLPNKREHVTSQRVADPDPAGAKQPAGAAKVGSNQGQAIQKAPAVFRPPAITPLGTPSAIRARHRGANSAIVGGATITNNKNAGVLNGTRMNRKP